MTLVTLLLVAPLVPAAPPTPSLSTGASTDGQDITDLAMDPTGEFVVAVVNVDKLKVPLPGVAGHHDMYPCNFGAPGSVSSGSGCILPGFDHPSTTDRTATGTSQVVDYISKDHIGYFAVGGPGGYVSVWNPQNGASPTFEKLATPSGTVANVSLSPDANFVVAAVANQTGSGRVLVYKAGNGDVQWAFDLSDKTPTALAYSRTNDYLVAGTSSTTTENFVYVLRPSKALPEPSGIPGFDAGAPVRDVAISRTGDAFVVGTSEAVLYAPVNLVSGAPQATHFGRKLSDPVQRVALSLDGLRFAAASGSSIYFYRALKTGEIAEEMGTKWSSPDGSTVADIAYDATGGLLVAIAGNRVYGFGPNSNTAVWSFDATDASHGGLDGPLKRVVVSDGAERIVVAGRTKFMPYRTLVAATGVFDQAQQSEVLPASNVHLSFTLTNTGSLADNYSFVLKYPPNWGGSAPPAVLVAPDESVKVDLSVDVPGGVSPGLYGLGVAVNSRILFDRGIINTAVAGPTINLSIPRAVVLNVTTPEQRLPSLKQGNDLTVLVTVRNRGNAEGLVNMSATQTLSRGAAWPLRFAPEQFRLAAGAETIVSMILTAPRDAGSGDRNDITIHAKEGIVDATQLVTAYVDPRFGADVKTGDGEFAFGPGELRSLQVNVTNTGNTDDVFNITTTLTPTNVKNDWFVSVSNDHLAIGRGVTRTVILSVRPAVPNPREASLVVKAASNGSAETESGSTTISLVSKPPTTTPKPFIPDVAPVGVAAVGALAALAAAGRRRFGGRR